MKTKLKLGLITLALGLSSAAHASTWFFSQELTLVLPIPQLDSVQANTFHYGSNATVQLNGFGLTSSIYYQIEDYNGTNAAGSYTARQWACHDANTLANNGNQLKLNLDSGRYKVNVVAVMVEENCDLAAFQANNLIHSETYSSNEFMVINHGNFDHNNPATAYLNQYSTDSYDMSVRWQHITGTQGYQLNISKNGVEYPLAVDADTYAAANQHTVRDVYNQVSDTFTEHTGFGDYTFSVQYQLNGELSTKIPYTGSKKIFPLKPNFFEAYAYNNKPGLPLDTVQLLFIADRRTPYFKVYEDNNSPGHVATLTLDEPVPGPATIVEKRDLGKNRYYDHLVIKTEDIPYLNRYIIHACADRECTSGNQSLGKNQANPQSLTPIATDSPRANFAQNMIGNIVNQGEYLQVGEDSTQSAQLKASFASVGSQTSGNPTVTPVMSEEILDRLNVKTEITAETTDLLGEKIDLSTGSVSFTQTDASLPGNNPSLPVHVTRTHKGANYSFQNSLEFDDWQLEVPSIHTTVVYRTRLTDENGNVINGMGFSGGWGEGKACTKSQTPQPFNANYDHWQAWEYFNGTTLNVPGKTSAKLLESSQANPQIVDSSTYRYITKDNWRISCLSASETQSGYEGFKATSPEGITYTFDRYRLVEGQPITKYKVLYRFYAFMVATKAEDRFGNKVTYNYDSNNRLTSIVGQDVGETNPRTITFAYNDVLDANNEVTKVGYQIKSATANDRTWHYDYTFVNLTNINKSSTNSLTKVTRPDGTAWQYDLGEFSLTKVKTQGNYCAPDGTAGDATGSITHPSGARGDFVWKQAIHGRTHVPSRFAEGGNETQNLIPTCFANTSIASKTLSGAGLEPMTWNYTYSGQLGAIEGASIPSFTGPLPTSIDSQDYKWTRMQAPDDSVTYHYFNRDFRKIWDGKEFVTDYYDTDGTTHLKRVEKTYEAGNQVGYTFLEHENMMSTMFRANETKTVQRLYYDDIQRIESNYISEQGNFNLYGKPTWTHGTNGENNKHQYTRTTYYHDTVNWVLNLPYQKDISDDGSAWHEVSRTTYNLSNSAYKALPSVEFEYGVMKKHYVSYSNGNLTHVDYNILMDNGNKRYQKFEDYKMGKARTITLPGRDNAASTMTAHLLVNDHGEVTRVIDFNGDRTDYSYDNMGRVASVTPADTKWTATTFDFKPVESTDIAGVVEAGMYKHEMLKGRLRSTTYLDGLYRPVLVKTKDTVTGHTRYQRKTFNMYDKPTFEAYPSASNNEAEGMKVTFDGLQRPIKTEQTATGAFETTTYLTGNKTAVKNYNGHTTTTTFDSYGSPETKNATRIESPVTGVVTTLTYNTFGNVDTITQGGVEQKHVYNAYQQLCRQIRPDTGVTAYGYDGFGQVIWRAAGIDETNTACATAVPAGEKTLYTYDNLGANKTINYSDDSADITYTYDNQGNLKTLLSGNVTQTYNYFSGGKLANETLNVDGNNWTISYNYDGLGSLSSLTYPNDQQVSYSPNAFGEPTKAGSYATSVNYFPDGQIQDIKYGNDLEFKTVLNSRKLPHSITVAEPEDGPINSINDFDKSQMEKIGQGQTNLNPLTGDIVQYIYGYDNQGNITKQTDTVSPAYSITGMTYDELDRLKTASGYWGNFSINYDVLGNITDYDFDNTLQANSSLPSKSLSYSYNGKNQLQSVTDDNNASRSFTYDNRGNVTHNGKRNFDFNHAQRITDSGSNTYLYDGHGRRVKRVSSDLSSTDYSLYSKDGKLLYRNKDGQHVNYIFMGKKQIARIDSNTQYIHTDTLGSPVVETDSNGSVIAGTRMHYRPFGETVETPKDEVGYTGHKFDTDLGLSYMQQRYYDPEIGRFYSDDPVGYTPKNSVMSFNRYLYVNNNPYKYVDPNGEFLLIGAIANVVLEIGVSLVTGEEITAKSIAVAAATGAVGGGLSMLAKAGKIRKSFEIAGDVAAGFAGDHLVKGEGIAESLLGASVGKLAGEVGGGMVEASTKTQMLKDAPKWSRGSGQTKASHRAEINSVVNKTAGENAAVASAISSKVSGDIAKAMCKKGNPSC